MLATITNYLVSLVQAAPLPRPPVARADEAEDLLAQHERRIVCNLATLHQLNLNTLRGEPISL
jgi:hypothetical protein